MKRLILLASLVFLQADAAPAGGSISGRVTTYRAGKLVAEPEVYVYLEQLKPRATAPKATTTEIHQRKQEFVPHVVVVPVGSTIWFPNDDNEEHNVFTPSDPPGPTDLGRYPANKKGHSIELDDAGEISFFCDVHQKMWAKVKVVETNQFARVVDTKFKLDNVAPGTYRVWAWAPDSKDVPSGELVVKSGDAIELPADLHVQLGSPRPHTRKDGQPYQCPQYCGQ